MKRKIFLELLSSDYSAGRFNIDVRDLDIRNPRKIAILSSTVKLNTDADFVKIKSEALSSLQKRAMTGSNNGFRRNVYNLVPDSRIVRSASQTVSQTTGVSDTKVSSISGLLLWFDFAPARVLDGNYAECSVVGTNCIHYYNRSPGPQTLQFANSYANGLALAQIGSAKGITRDGSWQSIVEQVSSNNPAIGEEFSAHFLLKAPSSTGLYSQIMYIAGFFELRFYGGTIQFKNSAGTIVATNIAYVPTRTYILSVKRESDGAGDYQFSFSMKDLDTTAANQTQITDRGSALANGGVYSWAFGRASFHFEHVMGPTVFFNKSSTAADDQDAIDWLEAQYTGNVEVTNQVVEQTHTYQLFSRKREEFECKYLTSPLQFLDLSFTDSTGADIQPVSGLLELEITE
jgi:hypothetical protein